MTQEQLNKIIENHQHYLNKDIDGWESMKADLSDKNLSGFFFFSHLLGIFFFGKSRSLTACLCRSKIVCHYNYLSFDFLGLFFGCLCTVCFGAELLFVLSTSGSLRSASFCCLD